MLYLLKGSRVREYHRQNVEILSASEGADFEVSYSPRWVQTGLRPEEGQGAMIVFADSPYETFTPVRFAVVEQVEEDRGRLTLRGRLGPFVCTDDRSVLDQAWKNRSDAERPGRHRFLVSDDNPGLYTPPSPQAEDQAWRDAVDSLASNPFFEMTTIIRVRDMKVAGRDISSEDQLVVGDRIGVRLELRSPHRFEGSLEPVLLCEPEGSLVLVGEPRLPPTGEAHLEVDVLESGATKLSLVLLERTLSSTHIDFDVEVRPSPDGSPLHRQVDPGVPTSTSSSPTGIVDLARLTRFLRRHGHLSHEHWLQLLDDQLLPLAPRSPVLLAHTATHADHVGRYDRVVAALTAIETLTPPQRLTLLMAAVRLGRNDLVPGLLAETDLSEADNFDRFLRSLKDAPESTVHLVMTEELNKRYLGDHLRTRFVQATWSRLTSTDLLCRAAEDVAYVDPDAGATLLLDRWPVPAHMPEQAIDLLLDWSVRRDRLGPYVRARLQRASADDDASAIERAVASIGSVSTVDQPSLRIEAGLHLARADHVLKIRDGFKIAVDGFQAALLNGDIDLALQTLPELSAIATTLGSAERETVEGLIRLAEQTVVESDELARWERMRSSKRTGDLRARTTGLRLFALGGKPLDWLDELGEELGLAACRWIEVDKEKSARHDWAEGVSERDIVLAVLPFVGHDSTSVKAKVLRAGAAFEVVRRNRMAVLDGIERAVGGASGSV